MMNLDDLARNPAHHQPTGEPDPDDPSVKLAQQLLIKIESMLDEGYNWAQSTLEEIHETVEVNGRATHRQVEAVENIEMSGSRTFS